MSPPSTTVNYFAWGLQCPQILGIHFAWGRQYPQCPQALEIHFGWGLQCPPGPRSKPRKTCHFPTHNSNTQQQNKVSLPPQGYNVADILGAPKGNKVQHLKHDTKANQNLLLQYLSLATDLHVENKKQCATLTLAISGFTNFSYTAVGMLYFLSMSCQKSMHESHRCR
eukprot:1152081-Pelagomonas_calceolata.AAC.5